jgi:uncharacterized phage protein (predicted DNA packaging)
MMDELLRKVKLNLILEHDSDDELLLQHISAAVDFAEKFQNRSYKRKKMTPSTEQAIIMLASHFYESRDGSTAGFFADNVNASEQVWMTVKRLLRMSKNWSV